MNNNKISGKFYRGLNPACGPYYMQGWLNTEYKPDLLSQEDGNKPYKADIYCDFFELSNLVEEKSFDKIYFGHFLEHIHEDRVIESIKLGMSLVKSGGKFMIVGPDYNKAVEQGITGAFLEQIGKWNYNNDPDHPYSHKWESTEEKTIEYMKEAGLKSVFPIPNIQTRRPHWPNLAPDSWQLFVIGTVVHN